MHIEVSKLFMQWMKIYCDSVNGGGLHRYNPVERREASKGGKEAGYKKSITELKLSVDKRDFYFSKLRDTEILCQTPKIEDSPIVAAIKRILYATDEDDGAEALSPIEEKAILETQNRKKHLEHRCRCCWKQRLSDVSDVHCSGSPLLSY
ncbi:hypothetical protein GOBAR_DD04488 [Gossypium barbadense]|nr:hypothetical protein GOBAR_DD04488 [Gossypium barbadense]